MVHPLGALIAAAAFSYAVTLAVRRYAVSHNVVDTPNYRSSHSIPTPRGGGLSIAVACLMAVLFLTLSGQIAVGVGCSLLVGGCAVAAAGWIDDRRRLGAGVRLVIHAASAIFALIMLGGLRSLRGSLISVSSPEILSAFACIGIVWSTNLFNFMDGIDGIAGIQTACIGIGGGAILFAIGQPGLAYCMLVLGGAALGFLALNWHPAKIFMGDVGSGFIGFYVAIVAVASENAAALPLLLWVVIMAIFVVDATATLVRRIVRGHSWFEAHRSHVYQIAVRSGLSHGQVVLTVGVIDCVLVGIAYAARQMQDRAGVIATIALMALLLVWALLRRWLMTRFGADAEA